jgi:dolichyl-phosphate beta-glucosyltransferase
MLNIAIIIPCYNEESRLTAQNIEQILKQEKVTIYFANDGSTDKTQQIIDDICKNNKNCYSLNYLTNEGKSKTIFKSVNKLLLEDKFDYIGYFDADFSTPAKQLDVIVDYINSNKPEFIFASRIKKLNATILRKTHRHYIGRIILTIINLRFNLSIYDTQCGCKIFSTKIIKESFNIPFITSWLFDIEIFIRLKNKKLLNQGVEFPIDEWKDIDGSKLKTSHFFKIFKEIINLYNNYHNEKK